MRAAINLFKAFTAPRVVPAMNPTDGLVTDFEQLEVYREARTAATRVFEVTKGFPQEECYSLVDQIRQASRSIGAQIAEAWGKRRYPRYFVSKLSDADAEQLQTRHWLDVAVDCKYLSAEEARELSEQLDRIGRKLNIMMKKAEHFRTHR